MLIKNKKWELSHCSYFLVQFFLRSILVKQCFVLFGKIDFKKAFTLLCLLSPGVTYGLEITNLKSGLLCKGNTPASAQVCAEKAVILLSGKDTCWPAGEKKACTRYGYSFYYEAEKANEAISCQYNYSKQISHVHSGNYQSTVKSNTVTYQLPTQSGYYIFPQYRLFEGNSAGSNRLHEEIQCFNRGEMIFKVNFITQGAK